MYPKLIENNFFDFFELEFTNARVIMIMRENFLFRHHLKYAYILSGFRLYNYAAERRKNE